MSAGNQKWSGGLQTILSDFIKEEKSIECHRTGAKYDGKEIFILSTCFQGGTHLYLYYYYGNEFRRTKSRSTSQSDAVLGCLSQSGKSWKILSWRLAIPSTFSQFALFQVSHSTNKSSVLFATNEITTSRPRVGTIDTNLTL